MGDGSRDDRTVYVKNLDDKVTEEILFELFLQAGPLVGVKRPKDQDGSVRPFAFVEFEHDISPPYARNLMDGIKLYGRNIGVQFRSGSKHNQNTRGGNSPLSTPPYNNNRSGGPSPAPNGSQNYLTPPRVQRAMSAPHGLLANPNAPFGIPHGMHNAFMVGSFTPPVPFPVDGQQQSFHQMQFGGLLDGHHGARQLPHEHRDAGSHHRRSSQDHQRQPYHSQGSEEERSSRSVRQDDHLQRHGSNRQEHRDEWRQHGSDDRRQGHMHRHQSHQHHRSDRRDHPYRR